MCKTGRDDKCIFHYCQSNVWLLTTAECAVINVLATVQTTKHCSAEVRSWERHTEHMIDGSEKCMLVEL